VLQPVDGLELTAHIKLLGGLEQVLDGGVLLVSSKDLLGLDSPSKENSCQHPPLPSGRDKAFRGPLLATLKVSQGTYLSGL